MAKRPRGGQQGWGPHLGPRETLGHLAPQGELTSGEGAAGSWSLSQQRGLHSDQVLWEEARSTSKTGPGLYAVPGEPGGRVQGLCPATQQG